MFEVAADDENCFRATSAAEGSLENEVVNCIPCVTSSGKRIAGLP